MSITIPEGATMRPIADLIPYARNARTHSEAQVAQIAASIREFGWTNPVLIDAEGGVIAGHGRLLAARKLGMEAVPVIELAHLTDAQKRAYILADNRLAESAGWDEELLALELADLRDLGFDLALTGFDADEVAESLRAVLGEADPGQAERAENYSRKIEAPIYTPKGERPPVAALYDETKTIELKREIAQADLPDDVARFLTAAAERHTVFDFRNIAEFYAHADPATQALMERSALVIIDFDQAIENGFVELCEAMISRVADFEHSPEANNA